MDRKLVKEKLKASESSPVPTNQKDNGKVRNQTTNVPRTRFPGTTIEVIILFILVIGVAIAFLEIGSN